MTVPSTCAGLETGATGRLAKTDGGFTAKCRVYADKLAHVWDHSAVVDGIHEDVGGRLSRLLIIGVTLRKLELDGDLLRILRC